MAASERDIGMVTTSKIRFTHLDSMRGIAACIVIVLHYVAVFYPSATFGIHKSYVEHFEWEKLFYNFPLNFLIAGRFAVCLFFILSGYVLSYSVLGKKNQGAKILSYMIKRPFRLGGLVLFTIMSGAILWWSGLFYNHPVSEISHSIPYLDAAWVGDFQISKFLDVFFFSPFSDGTVYNPPLWTIDIELYGSFLVFCFVLIFGNLRYRLILYPVMFYLLKGELYQGFVLGILFADMDKNYQVYFSILKNKIILSAFLLVGLVYASTPVFIDRETFSTLFYSRLPDFYSMGGTYAMIGAALVFYSCNSLQIAKDFLNLRFFRFLGKISYGLYVIHFLVIGSFSCWLFLYFIESMNYLVASSLTILISLPIILLLSYLVTIYVDFPVVKFAGKIGQISRKHLVIVDRKIVKISSRN